MQRAAAIVAKRRFRRQTRFHAVVGVTSGAMLLGLFGAGVGAVWSIAVGFGADVGALCGGLGVFILGLVLVPLDARVGKAVSLVAAAMAILAIEMAIGAIVWGIRTAMG